MNTNGNLDSFVDEYIKFKNKQIKIEKEVVKEEVKDFQIACGIAAPETSILNGSITIEKFIQELQAGRLLMFIMN
jgi:hypothetical protein